MRIRETNPNRRDAYSRKPVGGIFTHKRQFSRPHQSCHKQKSAAQTQTPSRTSRHISPHTAQRAYMYAICNYPKHTFPPLRYQVHRQYDNLASFPRTCAVGHASFSAHDVFEPVRVVTSSPCLAPLFYITARSFETRKRKRHDAKKRA